MHKKSKKKGSGMSKPLHTLTPVQQQFQFKVAENFGLKMVSSYSHLSMFKCCNE